uniref:ANK_REP_REGION domain-containing protein n=1 Tax=Angiostrongylus cantonensis TaxID=6313 RepID=A0A0K0DJU1_ANGCA
MKKRREEELRKELAKTNDPTKQLDLVSELGSLYRLNGDMEAARNSYERVAEIYSEEGLLLPVLSVIVLPKVLRKGDREQALKHAEFFRETAQKSGSCSQIQLSLHVTGWIYEKLNMQQSHDPIDLEKALSWCIKSIDYIKKFGHSIDADRKAVRIGGDSARRKAGLSSECSRSERRKMYELIADSFCSYGSERKEMLEHAIKFYKMMLSCQILEVMELLNALSASARFLKHLLYKKLPRFLEKRYSVGERESLSDKEKLSATVSIAQTFMDMEMFEEALDWFVQVLDLEKKIGRSETRLLQTRVLIFEAKSRCKSVSKTTVQSEFDLLISQIPSERESLKSAVYGAMSCFLAEQGDQVAANIYLQRSKQFEAESDINECDEDEDCENVTDVLDARSDRTILSECMEMAHLQNSDREIEKDRDKEKNAHGETRLHIAARTADTVMLEKLIAAGYDVNKRDHGGWTPISEAVSAGIRDNVRVLLKAGAEVDPVSTEVLNNDENSTGGGITPLMEACDKGFIEIARDLLKFGASVRIIEGLGAQSRKKEKHVVSYEERALSLEDDSIVLKSPTRTDVALSWDCGQEQRKVGDCGAESDSHSCCPSPELPLFSTSRAKRDRVQNSFPPCEIIDDFVIADELRCRKRRNQDSLEESSVQAKKRSQEIRSDTDSFSDSAVQKYSADLTKTPNALLDVDAHIVATLRFENEQGEVLRADKVVSFPRTATMAIAHDRFRSELSGHESKLFDIRLSDGREADANVPLSSLGEPLVIVCRLHKPTAEVLYKSRAG